MVDLIGSPGAGTLGYIILVERKRSENKSGKLI